MKADKLYTYLKIIVLLKKVCKIGIFFKKNSNILIFIFTEINKKIYLKSLFTIISRCELFIYIKI